MKEAGAHRVKLEGGERVAGRSATLTAAGIPVMAHIGFTPQSVNTLGGFRVQGRGDAAEQTMPTRSPLPGRRVFGGDGDGAAEFWHPDHRQADHPPSDRRRANCDAQVLVWQDMAGLTSGRTARFVKRFR